MYVEFNQVDTFTAGALGEPGQRIFLLQCIAAGQRVTVKCEKQQAQAIAAYLRRVLADVVEPGQELTGVTDPIGPPFDPVFVLGQVGLGYLPDEQRVLVQLDEAGAVDEQGDLVSDPALSRVRLLLSLPQAFAFCERSEAAVAGGRPLCRWCQFPIDPDGHICPRMN